MASVDGNPSNTEQVLSNFVVRGFGYNVTHLAKVPQTMVQQMEWISGFSGIPTPLVGLCGKRIRSVQKAVVVMEPGTPVTCDVCEAVAR